MRRPRRYRAQCATKAGRASAFSSPTASAGTSRGSRRTNTRCSSRSLGTASRLRRTPCMPPSSWARRSQSTSPIRSTRSSHPRRTRRTRRTTSPTSPTRMKKTKKMKKTTPRSSPHHRLRPRRIPTARTATTRGASGWRRRASKGRRPDRSARRCSPDRPGHRPRCLRRMPRRRSWERGRWPRRAHAPPKRPDSVRVCAWSVRLVPRASSACNRPEDRETRSKYVTNSRVKPACNDREPCPSRECFVRLERRQRPSVSTTRRAVSSPEKFCWPVIRFPSRTANPRQRPP